MDIIVNLTFLKLQHDIFIKFHVSLQDYLYIHANDRHIFLNDWLKIDRYEWNDVQQITNHQAIQGVAMPMSS